MASRVKFVIVQGVLEVIIAEHGAITASIEGAKLHTASQTKRTEAVYHVGKNQSFYVDKTLDLLFSW